VQHRILFGSTAAVLSLAVISAAVLYRSAGLERRFAAPPITSVSPSPPAPVLGEPAKPNPVPEQTRPAPPSFDIVKVGPTGTAVIAGRAEPGSRVTIRDGDKVIGEVTADRRGEWVLVPEQPIGPGDRLLSLEASNRQGGEAVKSDETVALSISPSGKGETALAVILPRDGTGAARVLQRPEGPARVAEGVATDKPGALSVDALEYDAQGRVVLSGRATPGATVQMYLGNHPMATTTADAAGGWSATSNRPVSTKRRELRLDQLAEDGRVTQRIAVPLAQAAGGQLRPGQAYTVQAGNSLWQIARRTYGDGVRYVIIYSANLSQIRDPERIYPGQVFKLPKS
jgi:nucleoid-associated protein YgaU